jgi:hypothetical protein
VFCLAWVNFIIFNDLDRESREFLYLARIVKHATKGTKTQTEQAKALTQWLATHVIKTTEYPGWEKPDYPDWFDNSSIAAVIKGGIGNCGYQSSNVIALTRYVGIEEYRRWIFNKSTGSIHEHSFAELLVDGKMAVFDPNMLIYQENKKGEVIGLKEMIKNPSLIENQQFREIIQEIKHHPGILKSSTLPEKLIPLDKDTYNFFSNTGIHLQNGSYT